MDDKTLKNIKILAIKSVLDPDYDSQYRSICRWFSSKFSVPLTEVELLSDEYVLKHYYEHIYNELYSNENKEEFIRVAHSLLPQSEEDIAEAARQDEEWVRQMLQDIEKDQKKSTSKQANPEEKPNLSEEPEKIVKSYDDYYNYDEEIE